LNTPRGETSWGRNVLGANWRRGETSSYRRKWRSRLWRPAAAPVASQLYSRRPLDRLRSLPSSHFVVSLPVIDHSFVLVSGSGIVFLIALNQICLEPNRMLMTLSFSLRLIRPINHLTLVISLPVCMLYSHGSVAM